MRVFLGGVVAAVLSLWMPGSTQVVAAKAGGAIRIAAVAPRSSPLIRGFSKISDALKQATGGAWKIKMYASGIAGDEKDTLRKIKIGQLDGTIVSSVGLSLVHPELAVMTTPGVIKGYKELERVQAKFNGYFEEKLAEKGYTILGWSEFGTLRYFTNQPLTSPLDLKKMRPWVWPVSHSMKSRMKAIGVTGIPLGVPEVYGALQTGMIDSYMSTALAAAALQWHTKTTHVTKNTHGPLVGALVMDKARLAQLPEEVREILLTQTKTNYVDANREARITDLKTLKKLIRRGYSLSKYSDQGKKDQQGVVARAQAMLVGRVFSRDLLDRILAAAEGK